MADVVTEPRTESDVEHDASTAEAAPVERDEVTEELLVEEVSIDGMCGVY